MRNLTTAQRQKGSALLIILLIVGVGAVTLLVNALNKANVQIARDKITAAALAQAKEALIGYAARVSLTPTGSPRPGDLPCPDLHALGDALEGSASTPCNGQALGRLPWKTLGLPDLRDGSGERLWYAVSVNFKNSTRSGTLNSETTGTITVRDSSGHITFDGSGTTGAIAVIVAPGAALTRQDSTVQTRADAGYNIATNYLDIGNGEDNANFTNSDTNGFIQGSIQASGVTVLNDQIITITPADLMPAIEKRVAGEVRQCLTEYAAETAPFNNQGRFPWAAPLNPALAPSYADVSGSRFGRIPDTPFTNTNTDSGGLMGDIWHGNCNIASASGWWFNNNWKEMVFYALADAYKPIDPMTVPSCGTCLTVNAPSASVNKQIVVLAAGRRLAGVAGGQPRTTDTDKGTIANYLENENANGDDIFERNAITSTFNDATAFAP